MGDAFEHVVYQGRLMDRKTMAFAQAMEAELGYELTITQGCYNPGGVSASAGTHDGGGVLDLASFDWQRKVKVAANLGAFAYHRPYIQGLWGEHVHLGIRNHGNLDPSAARQQQDWDATPPLDGLASHRVLTGQYHPGKKILFVYPVKPQTPAPPKPTNVSRARNELVQSIHSLGEAAALLAKTDEERVKARAALDDLKVQHRELRRILKSLPKR